MTATSCDACEPGRFSDDFTACEFCSRGEFQNESGRSFCYKCSEVLSPDDRNPHLWDTMTREEGRTWFSTQGADDSSLCGCQEGAWLSLSGRCHTCVEGMICGGMGVVEIEAGYFARYDN